MNTTRSMRDMLDAVHDHMTVFDLPEPFSVYACRYPTRDEEHVSIHLDTSEALAAVASALVTWVDTLTAGGVFVWHPPGSRSVHLEVLGRLTDGTTVRIWAGVPVDAADFSVEPGQRSTLPFGALRALAEVRA